MEDTKETLKKELKKLAGIILQDVKKTVSHLEGLIKNSRWDFKKYPTIEDCYFEEIASSLNPIETYAAILEKIDTYCVALGLSPFRFSFLTLGGFRFIADVFSDQGNIPSTNLILSSPRLVIEAVSNVYGNFLLVGSKLFKPQEVEEIFSRKISDQLIDYNKEIDSLGHKTPGAGEGDKQSGQLAITQKEKTEHPLNENIKTIEKCLDILRPYAKKQTISQEESISEEYLRGIGLLVEVQDIYRRLKSRLGLGYDWVDLMWIGGMGKDRREGVLDRLCCIKKGIEKLREAKEWELEEKTLIGQEPPGGGGKTAHQWRLAVKGTGQKEETTQSPKPSLIPSYYLDSPIAKIIGFLAAFVTLIMFVHWLFAR